MAKKKSSTSRDKKTGEEPIDFEASLVEVEQVVTRLESGELGLTESLQQYETGIKQLKRCQMLLDAAEQRVSLLSGFDADGNPVAEPICDPQAADVRGANTNAVRSRGKSATTPSDQEGGDDALSDADRKGDSVDDLPGLF